ncbi:MAG: hypothetical protein ACE5FC_06750, partial [Myxococcota bacterium]
VRTLGYDFTGWDDPQYVLHNPLIRSFGPGAIGMIFSHFYLANYSPLTLLLYSAVYALFGAAPWAYHAVNVALHALCAAIAFGILRQMALPRAGAAFGAALFLAHPVQVEVVAWVSQTKTLLATAFGLASFRLLLRFRESRPTGGGYYGASLFLFACALLSKPQAIAFPGIFLCLERALPDRLRRLSTGTWIPFAVLAIGGAVVSVIAQASVGAVKAYGPLGPAGNVLHSLVLLVRYLALVLFPVDLSVAYESAPVRAVMDARVAGAAALLAAIGMVAWRARQSALRPWHALGAFVAPLIPVLGWVPLNIPMADRYLYPAMLGAGWFLGGIYGRTARKVPARAALWIAPVLLALLGFHRMPLWQNGDTLWDGEIRAHPGSAHAWIGRGAYRFQEGNPRGAEADFRKAIGLDATVQEAWTNLGVALNALGKREEAVRAWRRAVGIAPKADWPRLLIARDLGRRGKSAEALALIESVIRARPGFAMAYLYRAAARERAGDSAGAEADLVRATKRDPFLADAHEALGRLREARGDIRGARRAYRDFLTCWGGDLARADVVRERFDRLADAGTGEAP